MAIVWAPNLLRSKSLEMGGVAALQGVGVQAVVTEYLIRYCELIFSDKMPSYPNNKESSLQQQQQRESHRSQQLRPKSLAISTPARLLSLDEARSRAMTLANAERNSRELGDEQAPQVKNFSFQLRTFPLSVQTM